MKDISRALFGEAEPAKNVAALALGDVVQGYLRFYADGKTHTARAKQLDTDKFLGFLARYRDRREIEHLIVKDWDLSATQRFVDDCLKSGEAPATVARRLATLKHMGRVLAERLPGFINPAREVKSPRLQAARPKVTLAEELL